MSKTYKFYCDPGHGWMAVKVQELLELAIITQISPYSYVRGKTVYLEEDCDAALFFNAYKDKHGVDPKFDYRHVNHRSPIRSYDRYNTNRMVDLALRKG